MAKIPEDPKLAYRLGLVIGTWKRFKDSHNLEEAKMRCCPETQTLWQALEMLEECMDGTEG